MVYVELFLPFVFFLLGCDEILKMATGPHNTISNQPSVTDNGYIYQVQFVTALFFCFWLAVKSQCMEKNVRAHSILAHRLHLVLKFLLAHFTGSVWV